MGFLIFAFRKLCLKREINQKNYRLMTISNRQNRLHEQISLMQQAEASMKNAWSSISNAATSANQNIFQMDSQAGQDKLAQSYNAYQEARKSGDDSQVQQAKENYVTLQQEQYNRNVSQMGIFQSSQAAIIAANQAVNNVFSAADQAQLSALQREDDQYDMEKETLESELTRMQEEYSNVKKAEQQAAKDSAPSFGQ